MENPEYKITIDKETKLMKLVEVVSRPEKTEIEKLVSGATTKSELDSLKTFVKNDKDIKKKSDFLWALTSNASVSFSVFNFWYSIFVLFGFTKFCLWKLICLLVLHVVISLFFVGVKACTYSVYEIAHFIKSVDKNELLSEIDKAHRKLEEEEVA